MSAGAGPDSAFGRRPGAAGHAVQHGFPEADEIGRAHAPAEAADVFGDVLLAWRIGQDVGPGFGNAFGGARYEPSGAPVLNDLAGNDDIGDHDRGDPSKPLYPAVGQPTAGSRQPPQTRNNDG